jgi:hypothetical protein
MFLIPGSKHYFCRTCRAKFLKVSKGITWHLKPIDNRKRAQLVVVAITALFLCIFLYMFTEHGQSNSSEGGQTVVIGDR